MTWTKLSDDFSDDCWELSDGAFRLHVEGLIWSNRKLLNLVLRKDEFQRWAKNPSSAEELVNRGWWTDHGDTYRIVHHGRYQRDREAVLKQQEANRRNGQRGGRRCGPAREQVAAIEPATDSLSDSLSERDGTGLDGPGKEGTTQIAESPQTERGWPDWHGTGLSPYDEYN